MSPVVMNSVRNNIRSLILFAIAHSTLTTKFHTVVIAKGSTVGRVSDTITEVILIKTLPSLQFWAS